MKLFQIQEFEMINGTHSLPQALPPKLEEVKMSPVPVPSPLDTKEAEKETGEEKNAEDKKDSVESIDKTAKPEATEGEPEVGYKDLPT